MTGRRAVAAAVAWVAALGVTLAGLHTMDGGADLHPLPLDSYTAGAEAARVVVAVVRRLALALGWYLLAVTVSSLALRIAGAPRAAARVEGLAPAAVRRVLRGAAAALATTTSLATGSLPAAATGEDTAVVMRRLPPEPEEAAGAEAGGADGPPVVMRRLPPPPAPSTAAPVSPSAPGGEGSGAPREHVVQPGEHLWAVAEAVLTAARGRPVTDGEIAPYWRLVVAENAAALADPDLVFPGQKVRVPPVPELAADV